MSARSWRRISASRSGTWAAHWRGARQVSAVSPIRAAGLPRRDVPGRAGRDRPSREEDLIGWPQSRPWRTDGQPGVRWRARGGHHLDAREGGFVGLGAGGLVDGRTGECRSIALDRRLHLHESCHLVATRSMRARSVRTVSSPSSRSAARLNSAASVSARWRFGRSKPTARHTPCRRC
jgi:hypothetical protein